MPDFFKRTRLALILSAVVTVLMVIGGNLFFIMGQPLGTITDILSIFLMLTLILVAWRLHVVLGSPAPMLSQIATIVGTLGMVVFAVFQTLLVIDILTFEQVNGVETVAGVGIGIWISLENYTAVREQLIPTALCVIGFVVGLGYFLTLAGLLTGAFDSLLSIVGFAATYLGYPIWAFWLSGKEVVDSKSAAD